MARKVASPVSDGSQKENTPKGKAKARAEIAKKEKTARMARGSAARRVEEEPEEDDRDEEEGQDEDGEAERRRVRLNAEGDSAPAEAVKPERMKTLPRDEDGGTSLTHAPRRFIPGSIVRIKLENFVTYDAVEFRPGPYLNMIFGPNGTGKSTIACAICLGLNFPPSVLGRATDLNSFVKIGTEAGYIEIELKGATGKPNLVVKRTLSAKAKASSFFLNGQAATGREVNNRMTELNVQVSNLCTFLPQDKVSEFAHMTPQQLLRETQRAAGNAGLTAWHDTLISAGKDLKGITEVLNGDRDQLKTLEERNANLERDVRRYEERQQIERDIELLELILPFKEYTEAKALYQETKEGNRKALERFQKLQARNAPILDRRRAIERELTEKERAREAKKTASKKKFETMLNGCKTMMVWFETMAEDLKNRLERIKSSEKTRKKEIERLERSVAAAREALANPPEREDIVKLREERRRIEIEQRKLHDRITDLQAKQRANVEEESRATHVINQHTGYLKQLDDVSHRKLESLSKWDRDCGDAVRWLRQNQQKFKMEVFEPPMLSCTVPDNRFVNAVEACFGASQLKTFVAQCEDDYALLNRLLIDTPEALGRSTRIHTWYRHQAGPAPPPPMSQAEMHQIGFDGYALDFIQCPDGMRWFLENMQLHKTAIALSPTVNGNLAMELVTRQGGGKYIIGSVMNSVTRSRYGKRLPLNQTSGIRQARNLVSQAVDETEKRRLEKGIKEARMKYDMCKEEAEQLGKVDAAIRAEGKSFKEELAKLDERKKTVEEIEKKLTSLQLRIGREEGKLKEHQNAPPVDVERARLRAEILTNAKKRMDIVVEYARLMLATKQDQLAATCLGLEAAQIASNKAALEELVKEKEEEVAKAKADFQDVHHRYEVAKEDSKAKLQVSKAKLASVGDDTRERFRVMEESGEVADKSADDIETELEAKRAQLEMNMHTNAGVVEQFKKRQQEIEALTEKIKDREKRADRIARSIKTARENWQPALEELVASIGKKFSAAFDRLGCAGEVRIREHDDFDKWAIDILVKFRDDEKLQLLTGERQSGGERSLTTILYLMSLTEEARAPFSLVDEINQGMDQRAERAVHNSLVEVTCKADSGQYFLITPKLLPDLEYAERMKVLCVNNGEWLPEETGIGNMMNMINTYVQHQTRSNASM
ncbi:P-loop containing nucleoside triphosphate hydrolase protein [Fomitopsis serialis]|uniref:P-loop containing nucleoside triphosphate hydrolase protein n=1 Tax=Fomitopsis serialis TaxID=139415 RepID=UPI002007E1BB|nr:P-loop containing nucleoside triphosphate hydrolase protein [Neoantrodia serialis]KAH9927340.1 P-loop containing nucleoside triphosphate hydrolase protein [Neoantrodia serialis]